MSIILNNREITWDLAYQINDRKYYKALLDAKVYPPLSILCKFLEVKDFDFEDYPDVLYDACRAGRLDIVKSIDASKLDKMMLWVAATKGHLEIVKYIKENSSVAPDITVSYQCIKLGHIEVAKYICENWPGHCVGFFVVNYVQRHSPEHVDSFKKIFLENWANKLTN
jgi:hypothetical protein